MGGYLQGEMETVMIVNVIAIDCIKEDESSSNSSIDFN